LPVFVLLIPKKTHKTTKKPQFPKIYKYRSIRAEGCSDLQAVAAYKLVCWRHQGGKQAAAVLASSLWNAWESFKWRHCSWSSCVF